MILIKLYKNFNIFYSLLLIIKNIYQEWKNTEDLLIQQQE